MRAQDHQAREEAGHARDNGGGDEAGDRLAPAGVGDDRRGVGAEPEERGMAEGDDARDVRRTRRLRVNQKRKKQRTA